MDLYAGDPNNPPLGTQLSEVIEVELINPRGVPLLGLLDEPLLNLLSPIGGAFALSPLVPEPPPLPRCELLLGVGGDD